MRDLISRGMAAIETVACVCMLPFEWLRSSPWEVGRDGHPGQPLGVEALGSGPTSSSRLGHTLARQCGVTPRAGE